MKRRSVLSAAAALGAVSQGPPVVAQVIGEGCILEPTVIYPPGVAERLVPPGRPAIDQSCDTDDAPFVLAPPPLVSLPMANPTGGDYAVAFVS